MHKKIILFTLLLLVAKNSLSLNFTLEAQPSLGLLSDFNAKDLCTVANNTATYLSTKKSDHFAVHSGAIFTKTKAYQELNISLKRVEKTLAFICQTYQEDLKANRNSRLHDQQFVTTHFDFIRWFPDKKTANSIAKASNNAIKTKLLTNIPQQELFLTKYYTKALVGSAKKTNKFNQALYALPYDEQGLTLQQAEQKQQQLNRYRFTRQQVISGILIDKKLAKPLIWLTEEALHDVLLQGTGVLNVDGIKRYFNVHRNNGIAYNYHQGKREQKRYWYFAEVPSIMGYGQTLQTKIAIKPQVTFAGNVADLGLGKLVMVSYTPKDTKQTISRMGILADQGGAFDNNLFQLDLLVDSYQGWSDYYQANKQLPDYAKAWIMLVK